MLRCACDPDSPCLELIFILFFFQHVTLVVLTVKKRGGGGVGGVEPTLEKGSCGDLLFAKPNG